MMSRMQEMACTVLAFSCASAFAASLLTRQSPPALIEIVFGVFPMLACATMLSVALLRFVGHEREQSAMRYARTLAGVACLFGVFLSLTTLWNDGRYYTILTPSGAIVSMLTLGFFPLTFGPIALIRFLPFVFGAGIGFRLWRNTEKKFLALCGACAGYFVLAFLLHALTWVGGILSFTQADTITQASDVFRILARAQADGYWTHAQAERFFAPLGRQGENGFLGIQAATAFLFFVLISVSLLLPYLRPGAAWLRRLGSKSVVALASIVVVGFALGGLMRVGATAYTTRLAYAAFAIVLCAWIVWWRAMREAASEAHEEQNERVRDTSLLLALAGSFILGWPMFLSILSATIFVQIERRLTSGSERWHHIVQSIARMSIAGSIGAAALVVALQEAIAPEWMFRILLATAFLIGCEHGFRHLSQTGVSRAREGFLLCLGIAFALFVAHQQAFWLLFLPSLAATLVASRTERAWSRLRARPLDIALGGIGSIILFFPQALIRN